MKKLNIITTFAITLFNMACDGIVNDNKGLDEAQRQFVNEVQYMTKEEALSKEVDYYKDPNITVKYKVRDLTGKDVIHECNILLKENEQAMDDLSSGRRWVVRTWVVGDAKEYAIKHPDKICGAEYYFEGVFTHYANGYDTRKARVLLMKSIEGKKVKDNWYVIQQYK